jgi:uncharacterized protein YegJ (DUF2314 family)
MVAFGRALLILIAALAIAPSDARTALEKAERDELIRIPEGDPDMAMAMRRARATLGDFLKLARKPKPSMTGFALKVGMEHRAGVEYFWVAPFEVRETTFVGRVNNELRDIRHIKIGQMIEFTETEIVDWMYREDGKMKGNFTACALLKRETKASADAFRKKFGLTCDFLK